MPRFPAGQDQSDSTASKFVRPLSQGRGWRRRAGPASPKHCSGWLPRGGMHSPRSLKCPSHSVLPNGRRRQPNACGSVDAPAESCVRNLPEPRRLEVRAWRDEARKGPPALQQSAAAPAPPPRSSSWPGVHPWLLRASPSRASPFGERPLHGPPPQRPRAQAAPLQEGERPRQPQRRRTTSAFCAASKASCPNRICTSS